MNESNGETNAAKGGLPAPHGIRSSYDRSLEEIKEGVLRMGGLVEEQIRAAIAALNSRDIAAAQKVIESDRAINELQRSATQLIAEAIAMQGPVARDLRYLLTLDHVAYELERMGDHASSVAKHARRIAPLPPIEHGDRLSELGVQVADLVRGIIRALVDADDVAARRVAGLDDEVDRSYRTFFDETLKQMRDDSTKVDAGTAMLFAAHYLERIGDRVTNIAEDIVFLASGEVEDLNP
jgi:phosphate transport system protein